MAFLVFALGLLLLVAGVAAGYQSLDLLPTGIGVLYAVGGAVAACTAVLTFAIGILIRRIDTLGRLIREQQRAAAAGLAEAPFTQQVAAAPAINGQAAEESSEICEGAMDETVEPVSEAEEPVNENRSGRLPTLGEIEQAIETPEAPPNVIGRYSSGGASYMIFADGSIEAEMDEGAFRFASMGEFKQYLAERKADTR